MGQGSSTPGGDKNLLKCENPQSKYDRETVVLFSDCKEAQKKRKPNKKIKITHLYILTD